MLESMEPESEDRTEEIDQLSLDDIRAKAARYRLLTSKQGGDLTNEEASERLKLLDELKNYTRSSTLFGMKADLLRRQLKAVDETDFSQDDANLLYGLLIIYGEAEK